jgi:uncharacterized protein YukE
MANQSVLELAVGTGKWDAGLKKAKQSLDNFTQANGGLQQALDKESQKMSQFVQMMGKMDSTAKTAKGQMNDYKSTIEQLTMQYNRMTDAQKQSIGQDYLNAIDQMKQKYQAVNEEIQEMNRSLNQTTTPDANSGGGGISSMLAVFGGNLMTKAAGYVAQLGSEVVEVMKASGELAKEAEGVTLAFERLGRPGLLDNLKEATHGTVSEFELMKAAVQFNDFKLPLEELGTMLAFAQQKAKDTGQSVDYMVSSIVTGLGRKSLMILDNLGLSANEVKNKMEETGDMTKAVGEIIREQMSKAGEYVDTASDKASRANAKLQDEMLALGNAMKETFGISSIDEFSTAIKTELVGAITFTIETINEAKLAWQGFMELMGVSSPKPKPQGYFKQGATMPNGTYVESTDSNGNFRSGYWNNGEIAWNSAGVEVVGSKREKAKTSRTGGKTTKEFDISKIAFNAPKVEPAEMIAPPSVWEQYAEGIRGTFDTIEDELPNITSWTKNFDPFKNYMDEMNKKLDQQKMAFQMAGQAANSFGAALAGIEDPATKAAGTVIQAIANIALGFGSAVAQASSMGPYAWIAYVAAAMGAMATAVSTVHSLTGYAEGGIVKGDSYSGDNLYGPGFGINAGELVLSVAQQNALANTLTRQSEGGGMMQARVSGENIYLALNNYLKRTGQGELLTWG